jgi:hypothetical protein
MILNLNLVGFSHPCQSVVHNSGGQIILFCLGLGVRYVDQHTKLNRITSQDTQEIRNEYQFQIMWLPKSLVWAILVVVTMLEGENGQTFLRKTSAYSAAILASYQSCQFMFRFEGNLPSISETDQMIFKLIKWFLSYLLVLWIPYIFYFWFIQVMSGLWSSVHV